MNNTVPPLAPERLAPPMEKEPANNPSRPRRRAWIIGLLLIPVLVFWVEYTEIVARGPDLAAMSLPMSVVFALLVIIPINLAVKRRWPLAALTQADLVVIYSMNVAAVYIGGIGMMQFLNPTLVGWQHFATSDNKWANWFRFIRPWAVPNPDVVSGYYKGRSSFFTPSHLAGWAGPIIIWTLFIFVLLFCMYCIATLIRRQWVENERLLFPIVQIPLEITRGGGATPLWQNRLFWLGAGVPVVLESLAAIHFTLSPICPYVPIKPEPALNLGLLVTDPPWNAIGFTTLAFYPLVIGLSFLLSLDVSFSCWFFYLFTKAENVFAAAFGLRTSGAGAAMGSFPYITDQAMGAFVGLAIFSLWLARPHLKASWRRAFRGDTAIDDTGEPMTYRGAYLGLFASFGLLVGFGAALGLSPAVSALFFGLFFLLALTMTRIRAEAGLPWGQGPPGLSHTAIVAYSGTQNLTPQELTAFSFVRWFDSDWRCLEMPAQLEAMKMASSASPRPLSARHLTGAIFAAVLVGVLASWAACLGLYYHFGADSATLDTWRTNQGHYGFDELQGWLNNPRPLNTARMGGAASGLIIVSVLALLRMRFVWFALNPIGYAVGNTDTMMWLWMPVLLGWLCKAVILRYGGIHAYRAMLPFFLGLVLGDYAISGILSLLSLATGLPGYRTFPI